MRSLIALASLACATAVSADPSPRAPTRLRFGDLMGRVDRVLVAGVPAKDWDPGDPKVLRVWTSGFKKLTVRYRYADGHTDDQSIYVGFAPGVELELYDHNGPHIRAQPEGPRCGRVQGHPGKWVLCDGVDLGIPAGAPFTLHCSNPVDLARAHYFWIDDPRTRDTNESPYFVPTLPGQYTARFHRGRTTISYQRSSCQRAQPMPNIAH